ncbi:hypothetical protein BKA70DRAFT_1296356 [Coprinopsis sp. MPI-PUGE-AT-0042]|nr:hypothetical protein BKA70DRAFT_1296356 [Coprinopsis sp. MPI-PUGE-AT-0042]
MDPKPPSVDSLPYELLEEMFTQYLRGSLEPRKGRKRKRVVTTWRPDWNRDWRPKDVSRIPNPVVLSHVCSLWRRLAHANPSLWSAVMVWGNISQRDVEMLRLWLSLSQSVPLQICLHQVRYASAAQDAWREVLTSVSAHGARWQKVEMCIAGVDDTPNCHRWWSGLRIPNLEYFDFQKLQTPECQWNPDDIWELYRKICTSSDKLCHIGADQYFSRWGWIPGVPWHNLKEINLTAGGVSYVEFIELLGLCASLEVARIFVFDLELLQDLSASSSALQFLELVTAEGAILDSLTLPALRSLHMMIANRIDEEETIWPAIERFSTRHPDCRLEEFQYYRQLVIQSFEYFTTVIALPLFQDLVRLYLEVYMSDRTLEALTFTPISQPLPCLEIISLERCHATDGTLSAMPLSRTNGVAVSRLREAHVVFGSYFRPVHREQFPKDLSL